MSILQVRESDIPAAIMVSGGIVDIKGTRARAVPDLEKYHGTDTFLTEALTIEANREIAKGCKGKASFLFEYVSLCCPCTFSG